MSSTAPVYAVILAGGVGSRLWPYSRRAQPKQLLPLMGDATMLQATLNRVRGLVPPEQVVVLTNREYVDTVRRQIPEVPANQIVGEPSALGTAAAIGLGAAVVRGRRGNGVLVCLPADHVISDTQAFHDTLERAVTAARAGFVTTIGIPPTEPSTGFGYIELGEALGLGPTDGDPQAAAHDDPDANVHAGADLDSTADPDPRTYRVARFVEKPDRSTAESYLESGRFLWNAGMFVWDIETLWSEYRQHLPKLAGELDEIAAAAGESDFETQLEGIWGRITDRTTVDYGIIERSDRVACVPATFDWNDVGNWSALADILESDELGNVAVGSHVSVESRNCLVFARSGRTVATVGLNGLVVVDTTDAVLVCPRDRAQDVREVVRRLEAAGDDALL